MKHRVFVDGQEGTTGLEIHERLARRDDLEILLIDPGKRKDPEARRALLDEADVAFLCLPDAAARESAALVTSETTRLIDASTAHRTDPEWAYGLPELSALHRRRIAGSQRVSVPGCHATGAVLALYPLVEDNTIPWDYPIAITSLTGYSGGGKKLIARYEEAGGALRSPRPYALGQTHKHLPEITARAGLGVPPVVQPAVGDFYRGMTVSVPLETRLLGRPMTAAAIRESLARHYEGQRFVRVMPFDLDSNLEDGFLDVEGCNGTNRADVFVFGNDERVLLMVRLDNLGKGASGAAVQCMNIMLGLDEGTGLEG